MCVNLPRNLENLDFYVVCCLPFGLCEFDERTIYGEICMVASGEILKLLKPDLVQGPLTRRGLSHYVKMHCLCF